MLGNACLLLNTLSMAVYYLAVKQLVQRYPAMCVAAWAYITAATLMGLTALTLVPLGTLLRGAPPVRAPGGALAAPPQRTGPRRASALQVPRPLWGPLAYWIAICSVLGYYVVTWATQHLAASQVRCAAGTAPAGPGR